MRRFLNILPYSAKTYVFPDFRGFGISLYFPYWLLIGSLIAACRHLLDLSFSVEYEMKVGNDTGKGKFCFSEVIALPNLQHRQQAANREPIVEYRGNSEDPKIKEQWIFELIWHSIFENSTWNM